MIPFSEVIPEPDITRPDWVPCDSEDSGFSITAQKELSCMAKDNEIYVVANMVDYRASIFSNTIYQSKNSSFRDLR